MKMCKWCNRVWGDNVVECKCGSPDLANIDLEPDWIGEWEKENA